MLHYAPIADMCSPNQTSSMRVQSRQCGMLMSHFLLLSSLSTPQGGLALYFGPEARSGLGNRPLVSPLLAGRIPKV